MDDEPIYIDLAALSGVDQDTFAAADRGDRQAQKVILRNLLTRNASASALTTKHWTHWMLRMIATGAEQAISDSLGSIQEAGRGGAITADQEKALNELYEQHFGPGEVGEPAAGNAKAAFANMERESAVVSLFLLADRLASGATDVTPDETSAAVELASALGATGAQAFFGAVTAQLLAQRSPADAFEAAVAAIDLYGQLAMSDELYGPKLGQTAFLACQIAQLAGEPEAATLLSVAHADAIAAYRASDLAG